MPSCVIVGVDPEASVLSGLPNTPGAIKTEGIGSMDTVYRTCDNTLPHHWIKFADKDAILIARRLIREEGLLVGGSAGAAVWGAITAAKTFNWPDHFRVVVLLPDGI
mmetsp:Transcript_26339/g.12389  ORF Transcript_26339/g.12389 Transcript_26339/m.12389 type:complete len:107 (-) Transcript_26339:517-837(-)|eukprot:CAMPEP_0201282362 /NCGR_PEP_ID=MMETSP1317-20130820/5442_1 /ASSEMBLY_ACC=CAM_ASM_000770 /TAXON_ID=187299 /ORGANISM="Undescribed Undescribed, Strain Undescribed" /LENGTH=106 /DNA_ID=CAMNT_0047594785 /DNA_START=421 /DNA_END=741 /DNA_ORIENTATION=-